MDSILPVTIIIAFYLAFVLKIGPDLMRFRKPLNIDRIVIIYNTAQVLFSMYLVAEVRQKFFFLSTFNPSLINFQNHLF